MSLFNAGLKFKHDGQNQTQYKASAKEIQRYAVAMRALVQLAQQQGARDARQAPGSQDATMDSAELLGAIDITQIGRHAGKATAVAGNDDKNQGLEHEATLHTCKKVEGYNFNRKKGNVSIATTNIVGNSGPHNAPAAI